MTLRVVKIGTSLLRGTEERTTEETIQIVCSSIAKSMQKGERVILVTSGAVGLGCHNLQINRRPEDLVSLQASAAIGQVSLMSLYSKAMGMYGYNVGQVLLTRSDLASRICYRNASKTLKKLLDWKVLPIINENDTVSNEELSCGDNDTLSALVAAAISADQLILLTDVDKLYSNDPRTDTEAEPISDVHDPTVLKDLEKKSQGIGQWGTGGIKTKLAAARIATESGITVHLADGRDPTILSELLSGSRGGTVFHPHPNPMGNRKSWLAHAIKPVGRIQLDKGASDAIQSRGASLLLVGIETIEGDFTANQPVSIVNNEKLEIARGISSLSSDSIRNFMTIGISSERSQVVIHRDVLVLTLKPFE